MNFPTSRGEELLRIEEELGLLGEEFEPVLDEPIRPRHKARTIRKESGMKDFRHPYDGLLDCTGATAHVRDLLSADDVSLKGRRPARIVAAEHSLEQLMDTIQSIGEATLAHAG